MTCERARSISMESGRSVDRLYKWALRDGEVGAKRSVTSTGRKKVYHSTIRNMCFTSCVFFITNGRYQWVYNVCKKQTKDIIIMCMYIDHISDIHVYVYVYECMCKSSSFLKYNVSQDIYITLCVCEREREFVFVRLSLSVCVSV